MTREAFREQIVEMQDALYRVAYGILPDLNDRADAVQECILKAWARQDSLRDERYLRTWVIRILINECYTLLRKRRRVVPMESPPERPAPEGADPMLHDAIIHLPEALRLPVILYYMQGYPVCEVAAMLRVPEGTVKSRLRKARQELRIALEGDEGGVCGHVRA